MGFSTPKTWAVGDILTASDMNTYVRDNIAFLGATQSQTINTSGVSGGILSSFSDLASGGVGPTVSLNTGTKALVILTAFLETTTDGDTVSMGFAVSGATTIAANVGQCYSTSQQSPIQAGASFTVTGLTAGSNTFTCKYLCPNSAVTASNRNLTVIPLP